MAHSDPEIIKLNGQYNKVIRVGKSSKVGSDLKASTDRSTYVNIDGKILDKPFQVYRMWYRFLQLALELEDQHVSIVTKMESVPLKKPIKDRWGKVRRASLKPIKKKVKVKRKHYADWDIDLIPTVSFYDWWFGNLKTEVKSHKELFYPESSVQLLDVKKRNYFVESKNYSYVRIDNRRRINDIEKDMRMLFSDSNRTIESVSAFPVHGTPNINTLINRYNAMILQLTSTETDKEMLASPVFRPTQYGMGENPDSEGVYYFSSNSSPGRAMRDLILPAKIALLSVCDGCFVHNPDKEYI